MIMVMLMLELKTITMFPTTNIINSAEPVGDGGPRENSSYRGLTMKIYEVGENRSGLVRTNGCISKVAGLPQAEWVGKRGTGATTEE